MNKHDTLLLACGTPENRKTLRAIFEASFNLLEADNTQQTVMLLEQNIDCIAALLLDITEPQKLDRELLTTPDIVAMLKNLPVIIMTSDDSSETLAVTFGFGAADVIPLHYDSYAMQRRIQNIVDLYLHKQHLEALVEEQAALVRNANDTMIDALSSIIEYRSVESGQHILRIRRFTRVLMEEVVRCCPEYDLSEATIGIISSAAALHDIGKIAIPDSILTKPGRLTEEEWEVMRTHSITGCHILESLSDVGDQEYLRYAHNICHYHHERWDGRGYPEGLVGEEIPICAQVVGLADAYDALTSKRVYKDAYSFGTAVNMILNGECGIFSPKLLECFKHVSSRFEALARAYADGLSSPKTEEFDVTLPTPIQREGIDSLNTVQTKYLSLLHYMNVFILEVDTSQGHYHILYNPYPELAPLYEVNTLEDVERLFLDQIVMPAERDGMRNALEKELPRFLHDGLRRQSFRFHLRSRDEGGCAQFEFTFLRPNIMQHKVTFLLRKLESTPSLSVSTEDVRLDDMVYTLLDSAYFCRNDYYFTLERVISQSLNLAGYSTEEIQEKFQNRLIELVVPEDREFLRREFTRQLSHGSTAELEFRILHKSGQVIWVLNKTRLVVGVDGQEHLYSVLNNITSSKVTLDMTQEKLDRYETILAKTENILFDWDMQTDTIIFSNTWERIFGFAPIKDHARSSLQSSSHFHPDDLLLFFDAVKAMEDGSDYEMLEIRIVANSGRYLWCRIRATAIRDRAGRLLRIAGIIISIDSEKQETKALMDRAERDSLTKLLNNQAGRKYAEEYFSQKKDANCALLIIDLDDFKQFNDQYGHMFGDTVLTRVSEELRKLFRAQDIIARIGGDEFMVLMHGVSDRDLVGNRCQELIALFGNVFRGHIHDITLSCSIGIALAPEHGTSYFDLFQHADQAVYQAKERGKNNYTFYSEENLFLNNLERTPTAVNVHIDSDEEPGLADNNIVHHVFRRLYSSNDVDASIHEILSLIGQQMNVSRVYVFENDDDNKHCSNTYEWCNAGITPEIQNLQNISYETDIPGYADNFDEHGIFYCPDVSILPQKTYDIVAPQGIRSMLQCAIRDNGTFRGYIGFDECVRQRWWSKEQIQMLSYFSEMLSVFLLKRRAQEKTVQRANELASILDNQNAWIYIIDPETYQLKYLNAKTRELAPAVKPGMCCYQGLRGLKEPCGNCPAGNIRQTKTARSVIFNEKFDIYAQAEATLIQWEGTESCLLTCREISQPPVVSL